MRFDERQEGDYRVYAGAMESSQGDGFIAAVVVNRSGGAEDQPREVFRDVSLACGHRWANAEAAVQYALGRGREVVRTEPHRLL